MNESSVAIVIVTHNSEKHIDKCLNCIEKQTLLPRQVIIVDSGSHQKEYLEKWRDRLSVELVFEEKDIGFCRGNNVGMTRVSATTSFVFFLNPDAFLTPTFLAKAVAYMQDPAHGQCGALTGLTLGYSIEKDQPTGLYDSTGIFTKWWGRWYDRGQAELYRPGIYSSVEEIPAICGAAYFCRLEALKSVELPHERFFDENFFMYKEDIDLSLRLKKQGWKLLLIPSLIVYHCRGWNPDRKAMPKKMRMHSACNELKIHWRQKRLFPIVYSLLKCCAVKCLNW